MNRNHATFTRRSDLGEKHFRCDACKQSTRNLRERMGHALLSRLPASRTLG